MGSTTSQNEKAAPSLRAVIRQAIAILEQLKPITGQYILFSLGGSITVSR
jgi:hypothetical protein